MSHICALQYCSHSLHTIDHLKCGPSDRDTEFLILFNIEFNVSYLPHGYYIEQHRAQEKQNQKLRIPSHGRKTLSTPGSAISSFSTSTRNMNNYFQGKYRSPQCIHHITRQWPLWMSHYPKELADGSGLSQTQSMDTVCTTWAWFLHPTRTTPFPPGEGREGPFQQPWDTQSAFSSASGLVGGAGWCVLGMDAFPGFEQPQVGCRHANCTYTGTLSRKATVDFLWKWVSRTNASLGPDTTRDLTISTRFPQE